MKPFRLSLIAVAALAIAACGDRNQDALEDNAAANLAADELNMLADNAAADANAEMQALEAQQNQLETEADNAAEAEENVTTEPSEVEDDVQGM